MGRDEWECPKCKRYKFSSGHKCPPEFLCWMEDTETSDDGSQVFASSSEEAAESYAETYDASWGEGPELDADRFVVVERAGVQTRYRTSAELSVDYSANEWTVEDGLNQLRRAVHAAVGDLNWLRREIEGRDDLALPSWMVVEDNRVILTELVGEAEYEICRRAAVRKP